MERLNKFENTVTTIMPLGNSITFDNRVGDERAIGDKIGYRYPLYNLLNNAGYSFSFIGSEDAGGNYLPFGYTKNAGFPGISDDQLLTLLKTGRQIQPFHGIDRQITVGPYLNTFHPDIILLHIGTNGNDKSDGTSPDDVEEILDEIKRYEDSTNTNIKVILARIIDRAPNQSYVHTFNDNIETMALDRVNNPANDAYPDDIVIVDMEDSAGFNYTISPDPNGSPGDMNDIYHPNDKGYAKMAQVWFNALKKILPNVAPQIVTQPEKIVSIIENSSLNISVAATSNSNISYQWIKDGTNIAGANSSVLNINNVSINYNESKIWCKVYDSFGTTYSDTSYIYVTKINERISNSLKLLYTFDELQGSIVNDKSEIAPLFPLQVSDSTSSKWLPVGIDLFDDNFLETSISPSKFYDEIFSTGEFTIELWVQPKSDDQTGPARILTLSEDPSYRNLTIGQSGNKYSIRLRTNDPGIDLNGNPEILTSEQTVKNEIMHLVLTKDKDGIVKFCVNGNEVINTYRPGSIINWNTNYKLGLGNEFNFSNNDNRTWLGTYYLVALYSRALSSTEITHNYSLAFPNKQNIVLTPSDLSGEVENESEVLLSWRDNSNNENGFIVERKANHPDSIYHVLTRINSSDITEYLDKNSKFTTSYFYRVIAKSEDYISSYSNIVKIDNITTGIYNNDNLPKKIYLSQNYPNPFNPNTKISFGIPSLSLVTLKIYDVLGKEVAELVKSKVLKPGNYTETFSMINKNLASGIYYYVLEVKDLNNNIFYKSAKKMILVK